MLRSRHLVQASPTQVKRQATSSQPPRLATHPRLLRVAGSSFSLLPAMDRRPGSARECCSCWCHSRPCLLPLQVLTSPVQSITFCMMCCIGVSVALCYTTCLIQESDYCMLCFLESHGADGSTFDKVTSHIDNIVFEQDQFG